MMHRCFASLARDVHIEQILKAGDNPLPVFFFFLMIRRPPGPPLFPSPPPSRSPAPPREPARTAGTADPGPGPPRVPEHPREGLLPSRCTETRQARTGQAARVEEPPPGTPPRRGKNDEKGAHTQGKARTHRLNGKLRTCPETRAPSLD